jgi:endothelin-converting enzyme/putative endopeptidase
MDIVVRRDPKNQNNKMSLKQVQALTPSFDWNRYLTAMHAPSSQQYLVLAPDFFRGVEKLIQGEPLDHWRTYFRYQTLRLSAPFLSQPLVDENFDFYGRTLFGSKENPARWRRCSANADNDLGHAVGQAYVARYFPPENKERMLQMVKAIDGALHKDIDAASWMSAETRQKAHIKLNAQIDKIGYPDRWYDYSSIEIKRDDFFGNVVRSGFYETNAALRSMRTRIRRLIQSISQQASCNRPSSMPRRSMP